MQLSSREFQFRPYFYHREYSQYSQKYRAHILEVQVRTESTNEYGQVASSVLKIDTRLRSLEYWQTPSEPVYNGDTNRVTLFSRGWDSSLTNLYAKQTQGRVLCTLDERTQGMASCHAEIVRRKAMCVQIASFEAHYGSSKRRANTDEAKINVYGLILEPTGMLKDEYKRIGTFEIAAEDGLADGWETGVVTIV